MQGANNSGFFKQCHVVPPVTDSRNPLQFHLFSISPQGLHTCSLVWYAYAKHRVTAGEAAVNRITSQAAQVLSTVLGLTIFVPGAGAVINTISTATDLVIRYALHFHTEKREGDVLISSIRGCARIALSARDSPLWRADRRVELWRDGRHVSTCSVGAHSFRASSSSHNWGAPTCRCGNYKLGRPSITFSGAWR